LLQAGQRKLEDEVTAKKIVRLHKYAGKCYEPQEMEKVSLTKDVVGLWAYDIYTTIKTTRFLVTEVGVTGWAWLTHA